jgi:hypothetical protein
MSDNFDDFDRAAEEEAYNYLWLNHPALAQAITKAIERGETPETVKLRANLNFGPYREALTKRCELASRHIANLLDGIKVGRKK